MQVLVRVPLMSRREIQGMVYRHLESFGYMSKYPSIANIDGVCIFRS
jgi:hypothetical protein